MSSPAVVGATVVLSLGWLAILVGCFVVVSRWVADKVRELREGK